MGRRLLRPSALSAEPIKQSRGKKKVSRCPGCKHHWAVAGGVTVTLANSVPRCANWALRAIGNGVARPAFEQFGANRDR